MTKYDSMDRWCPIARQNCRSDCALQLANPYTIDLTCALANAGEDEVCHSRPTFRASRKEVPTDGR